jgi:hypothetical protein
MKLTNGWRSQNKNVDRIEIKLRLGSVTIFELGATIPFDPVAAAQWVWDRKVALDAA